MYILFKKYPEKMNHFNATIHLNLFAVSILPFLSLDFLLSVFVYEYAKLFSGGTIY